MNKQQRHDWHAYVFGADLSWAQKVILLALETFTDYPAGTNAFPGNDALAEMCGCDEKTVRRALERGVELGLIEQTERHNPKAHRADAYRLLPVPVSTGHQSPVENISSGHGSPVEPEVLLDNSRTSTGLPSPPSLDSGAQSPVHSTSPLTPGETPSSLRSDGEEIPRSQARTPTELHRLAQKIVSTHVDYRLSSRHTRSGFDRAVRDALARGLARNTIAGEIVEWNFTALAEWDERLPGRCVQSLQSTLRRLAVTPPVTSATDAHPAEMRRP